MKITYLVIGAVIVWSTLTSPSPARSKLEDPEAMMREAKVKLTELGAEKINVVQTTNDRIEVVNKDGGRFEGYH